VPSELRTSSQAQAGRQARSQEGGAGHVRRCAACVAAPFLLPGRYSPTLFVGLTLLDRRVAASHSTRALQCLQIRGIQV
jgi:hypothetical protein